MVIIQFRHKFCEAYDIFQSRLTWFLIFGNLGPPEAPYRGPNVVNHILIYFWHQCRDIKPKYQKLEIRILKNVCSLRGRHVDYYIQGGWPNLNSTYGTIQYFFGACLLYLTQHSSQPGIPLRKLCSTQYTKQCTMFSTGFQKEIQHSTYYQFYYTDIVPGTLNNMVRGILYLG